MCIRDRPKTAVALLQAYESVEGVYDNLQNIPDLKVRGAKSLPAKLELHKEQALLSKQLATVAYDAPIDTSLERLKRRSAETSMLQEVSAIMAGRGDGLFNRLANNSKKVLLTSS